jgi:hypothetical protein
VSSETLAAERLLSAAINVVRCWGKESLWAPQLNGKSRQSGKSCEHTAEANDRATRVYFYWLLAVWLALMRETFSVANRNVLGPFTSQLLRRFIHSKGSTKFNPVIYLIAELTFANLLITGSQTDINSCEQTTIESW